MSYNGSGTFVINSTGQPVVANTVISATVFNALTADLATGLSTAITKDGQTTITANIPFGSNKITALGAGTAATDAANLSQVQTTAAKLINVTGTDTITGTMTPQLTSYAAGQLFYFVAAGANTGAVTINIDGLGAKSVTRDGSVALANGDINSGEVVVLVYDGTRFQMINAANSFGNTTINGTLTVTGNTGLQANVSITSALSVGGTFNVTGAATLGSTLAVTGKSDLPTVSTASMNAAVALITTGTVTNLTATGASIASANIGNLQFTAASIASINAGVAVVTNLTATSASIASANVGTAVITTGTVTNLTSTSASVASANAAVALITTGTVTNLTSTSASIASANVGTAVVTGLTVTGASIASVNVGAAVLSGNLTLNGGTANGVLYLNGSKVATSGSALVFDGTNLGIGTASPATKLTVDNGDVTVTGDGSSTFGQVNLLRKQVLSAASGFGFIKFQGYSTGTTVQTGAQIVGDASATWTSTSTPGNLLFYTTPSGSTTPVNRLTLDSSGNLGLGVTPSAWSSAFRALQIGAGGGLFGLTGDQDNTGLLTNAVFDTTDGRWEYIGTGFSTLYQQDAGTHAWFTAPSGTAGNAITFTQAMTLDASGNLGLGTTSLLSFANYTTLRVGGSSTTIGLISAYDGTTDMRMSTANNGIGYVGTNTNHPVAFITNATERARITSGGQLIVGATTGPSGGTIAGAGTIDSVSANNPVFRLLTDNTTLIGGFGSGSWAFGDGTTNVAAYAGSGKALLFGAGATERARITAGGQFLIGTTSDVTVSAPAGATVGVQNLGGTIICSVTGISFSSPYTQNVVIDIAWNNWGANNVIGLVDLIAVLREWANTGGTAFGKVFATNTSSAATFSTFNTTDVTVSQCTIAAASGGNYTLQITIDPSNNTDRASVYMVITGTGGTGTAVSSITVSVV